MMLVLQVITVFLVSVAMALSLAHALEFPGKIRLHKEQYIATQSIYYPGFTIGGGIGEGLGLLATFILLVLTPRNFPAFWWTLIAFIALAIMHLVFWIITQPVNRHWLAGLPLSHSASIFFAIGDIAVRGADQTDRSDQWKHWRDRWEYSHIIRAVLAGISLISLTVAVATYSGS